MLDEMASADPGATAIIDAAGSVTFGELGARVAATASFVDEVVPSTPVAVIGANHRIWVELYYGIPASGRTLVFLNHRLHARELLSMIERSGSGLVVGDPHELERLEQAGLDRPQFAWDTWSGLIDGVGSAATTSSGSSTAPAWLLFTSGTTAAPKGAMLSNGNILAAVESSARARPVEHDDVYVFPFPLCHVAGYNVVHRHAHGRPVVLMPGFSAPEFCDIVEREHATSTSLAATMLATLVDLLDAEPGRIGQLRSLRSLAYGAAPMPTPLLRRADSLLGVEFAQGYGMTELAGNAVFLDAAAHRRGLDGDAHVLEAAGRPAPGVELRVVDEDRSPLPDGDEGEILVRAGQVMSGYLDDEAATASALVDGWLHTGDVGRIVDGLLYVVDRKKDIVITGGENVSSLEVEAAVLEHPDVSQVAVVGVPDPVWGENVCAVVVPEPGSTVDATGLVAFVRTRLAGFKVPRHVVVVDELPVTASGKVVKADLRARLADDPALAGERL